MKKHNLNLWSVASWPSSRSHRNRSCSGWGSSLGNFLNTDGVMYRLSCFVFTYEEGHWLISTVCSNSQNKQWYCPPWRLVRGVQEHCVPITQQEPPHERCLDHHQELKCIKFSISVIRKETFRKYRLDLQTFNILIENL